MIGPRVSRRPRGSWAPLLIAGALALLPACRGSAPPEGAPPAEGETAAGEGAEGAEADAASGNKKAEAEKGSKADVEDASVSPLPRASVEIYFPSALENGLVGEFREIFATSTPGDRAKQIVTDLISGPTSPEAIRALPPDVRLRQAYVLDSGVAYLDFNAALTESIGGGSMEELLVVYSIVDSVALNIPEITHVGILIDGQPIETLNGHIDLRHPLPADKELVLGSIVVRARPVAPTAPAAAA